jgi:hypothetical protein
VVLVTAFLQNKWWGLTVASIVPIAIDERDLHTGGGEILEICLTVIPHRVTGQGEKVRRKDIGAECVVDRYAQGFLDPALVVEGYS